MVELAAYLARNVAAVPAIKTGSIVLDPLQQNVINANDVRTHLESFLIEKGLSRDFILKVADETITIIGISGRKIEPKKEHSGLLVCPFCGMVTPYEEEMDVHIKADLAGGAF